MPIGQFSIIAIESQNNARFFMGTPQYLRITGSGVLLQNAENFMAGISEESNTH